MRNFLTPVGRLVQGDCFTPNLQTDNKGVAKLDDAGNKIYSYYIGVAFAKTDVLFNEFYQNIVEEAKLGWPEFFNAQGQCTHPRFAFKVMDGDGVDDKGKPNNMKPGFAGHWVLKCSSNFVPTVYHTGKYNPVTDAVTDKHALRLGYYVRVAGTMKGNRPSESPGVYINFNVVEITAQCHPDEVIIVGPDANAIFGGAPVTTLPPGAVVTPMGAAGPASPGGPVIPIRVASPAVRGPGGPAGPGSTLPAAAGPTYTMTGLAEGYTREQYHVQGWTDDQLVAAGKLVITAATAAIAGPPGPGAAKPAGPSGPGGPPGPAAPNHGFVDNAIHAGPTYTMTAAAEGYTREQYHVQGWTDDQLVAAGKLVIS